jgi:hypothetical protein
MLPRQRNNSVLVKLAPNQLRGRGKYAGGIGSHFRRTNLYERFTDRARKVMQKANQVAKEWGWSAVQPNHILYGICDDKNSVGGTLLRRMGVSPELTQKACRERKPESYLPVKQEGGIFSKLPQGPLSKKVIEHALHFASSRNNNYVGTEHLLYGLVAILDVILIESGVTKSKISQELDDLLGTKVTEDPDLVKGLKQFADWQFPVPFTAFFNTVYVQGWLPMTHFEWSLKIEVPTD